MADTANLVIKVDAKGVKKATDELEKLGYEAKQVEGKNKKLTRSFDAVGKAVAGLGFAYATFELLKFADTTTRLTNLLKVSADENENLGKTLDTLTSLSIETNSALESTVSLYAKLKQTTEELNLSQTQLLTITQAVNQSFAISGADTQEAASAIKQLSQALASGAFRGDEFNSVAENAPRLMNALADSLGRSIGELREMAAQGELTSEVLAKGLLGQADKINQEFSGLDTTVSQGFTNMTTGAQSFLGALNELTGASSGLANLLTVIGTGLDDYGSKLSAVYGDDDIARLNLYKKTLAEIKSGQRTTFVKGLQRDATEFLERRIKEMETVNKAIIGTDDFFSGKGFKLPGDEDAIQIPFRVVPDEAIVPPLAILEEKMEPVRNWVSELPQTFKDEWGDEQSIFPDTPLFNLDAVDENLTNVKNATDLMLEDIESNVMSVGEVMREAFYEFSQSAGDALASVIIEGENMGDAMKSVVRGAIKQVISGLVQIAIQETVLSGVRTSLKAGETAAMVAQGTAISAAMAPAATLTTAATGGANLASAQALLPSFGAMFASVMASTAASSVARQSGGYLQSGQSSMVAENGIEIFTPNRAGRVFNSDEVAEMISGGNSGNQIALNINAQGENFDQWLDNGGIDKIQRKLKQAELL